MFKEYFTDLHIHVGINEEGKWVKIPTSRNLTVRKILDEALTKKGLHIVGIADALSPLVLKDLNEMVLNGLLKPQANGGYRYQSKITLLLGAEIETTEENGRLSHTLIYLPDILSMKSFAAKMAKRIKNINLSSQNAHMPLKELVKTADSFEAIIIPAHIFTPHKSVYGSCTQRMSDILPPAALKRLNAVELGLSADSFLADRLSELSEFSFLTNSDAHSLGKIGREYNVFSLSNADFKEISLALANKDNRKIKANYGLNPRLGKYHRSVCANCGATFKDKPAVSFCCAFCGANKKIKGVLDRIEEIADFPEPSHPPQRPKYFYQIPLEFITGLGKKTMAKLFKHFKSEIEILHLASYADLAKIAGEKTAGQIIQARKGETQILDGGGGIYGKARV